METGQLAPQLLEMVAGWHAQILIGRRIIDHLELTEQPTLQVGWNVTGT